MMLRAVATLVTLTGAIGCKGGPEREPGTVAALSATTKSVRKARTHEMRYYLALPEGWSPGNTWPILVAVAGGDCNWLGMLDDYQSHRENLPFILIIPQTLSNAAGLEPSKYAYSAELLNRIEHKGRIHFDEEGLLAVVEEVQKDFSGEKRFFITGFSGGGVLAWRMILRHPDRLAAAAPACPNFNGGGQVSRAPERKRLPVRVFQGERDPGLDLLEMEWGRARSICEENGFTGIDRVTILGAGHSNFAKEVLEFFASFLSRKDSGE